MVNTPQISFALDAAGIPYTGIEPADGTVHYASNATAAQIQQGNTIVAQWTNPTAQTLQQAQRAPALALLSAVEQSGLACDLRAICVLLVQQFNLLRDRLTAQDNAVAAFTTTADLKSRWAALAAAAPLPDITKAQVLA